MTWLLRLSIGALVLLMLLPTVAAAAAQAIPFLISVIVLLAVAHLAWPSRRNR